MRKTVAIVGGFLILVLSGMAGAWTSQEPSSEKNGLLRNQVIAGGSRDFMEVRHLVLKGSNREIGRALAAVASEQHHVKPANSSDRLRTALATTSWSAGTRSC